jgi:hypothetical protein
MNREDAYEAITTLFLAGRLPGMNHARHVAVAQILRSRPSGRELMHLGLQITAIRAGVPGKYDRALTDRCWEEVPDGLPGLEAFADLEVVRAGR